MNSLKKHSQQGFTIVELLIVIVVIGILAALVITTYSGIQQRGRNTERQTDIKAVKSQLEAYYANNGRYPTEANLDNTNAVAFIAANMKGLDKEALRDPKAAATTVGLAAAPAANFYAYDAVNAAGTACDNIDGTGTDCTKYTLTATKEGGGTIVETSAN